MSYPYKQLLWKEVVGKVALVSKLFGVSIISAIRVGLLLAPGGEFAFVAFGEAVNQVCTALQNDWDSPVQWSLRCLC